MKKIRGLIVKEFMIIVFLSMITFVYAQSTSKKPVVVKLTRGQQIEQGRILVSKEDCSTCHQQHQVIVGPSYKQISEKYTATDANVLYLADKIRTGGSGVWGDTEMASHTHLTTEEAKAIVYYILSLQ